MCIRDRTSPANDFQTESESGTRQIRSINFTEKTSGGLWAWLRRTDRSRQKLSSSLVSASPRFAATNTRESVSSPVAAASLMKKNLHAKSLCKIRREGAHPLWADNGYTQLSKPIRQQSWSQGTLLHRTLRFFPAMVKTIVTTHHTWPWRDGQAEWASVAWMNTGMVHPPKVVTNPSNNRAQCSLTLLVWLCQTSHNFHVIVHNLLL